MGWDAFHLAEVLLTQPLMVVVGDRVGAFGAYRDGCEIIGRAASKHKELVVVEGYSHYDLYDKPEPVKQALDKLIPFLQNTFVITLQGDSLSPDIYPLLTTRQ